MKGKDNGFKFCQLLAVVVSCVLVFVSPVFAADKPVWRILWVTLPTIDWTNDQLVLINQLTEAEMTATEAMAMRLASFVSDSSNQAVELQMDVVRADKPVASLTLFDNGYYQGYYMEEHDLPDDIQTLMTSRQYQSVIVTFKLTSSEVSTMLSWTSDNAVFLTSTKVSYQKCWRLLPTCFIQNCLG